MSWHKPSQNEHIPGQSDKSQRVFYNYCVFSFPSVESSSFDPCCQSSRILTLFVEQKMMDDIFFDDELIDFNCMHDSMFIVFQQNNQYTLVPILPCSQQMSNFKNGFYGNSRCCLILNFNFQEHDSKDQTQIQTTRIIGP